MNFANQCQKYALFLMCAVQQLAARRPARDQEWLVPIHAKLLPELLAQCSAGPLCEVRSAANTINCGRKKL